MINEERYARQITLEGIGREGQEKLLNSSVLVIGAGGLGSASLPYLAAAGVGTIAVADYDSVSLANLQRQILYDTDDIGKPKAAVAAEKLLKINPDVKTVPIDQRITPDNIIGMITEYDFIIDAADRIGTKFMINDACVIAKKPYSHAGVIRYGGQAMTYVPGEGPCLRCLLDDVPDTCYTCTQVGVLGPSVGVLGSIQASECIKYLTGAGVLLTGKVFLYDAEKMVSRITDFPASPDCALCSESPSVTSMNDRIGEYFI